MLLYRLLSFFWQNNRATLFAYCFGSIALLSFLFFQAAKLDPDFNALSLLGSLNLIFIVFSLLLSRNLLYKFYRNKTHYFFAQLPISPLKIRLYEHICLFILCALPYIILLPLLLLQVYYSGLWSTHQVASFLGFQLVLWIFYANAALCLAMLGRICWYLFWGIVVGLALYIKYNKNYQIDLINFVDVNKVLFKANILSLPFVINYLTAAIVLYISAFFLSFTVDKNAFGLLHAKETSLSKGIFMLYLVILISSYFYFIHQLSLSKSQFAGLHLTQITPNKADKRGEDYWSSSVQLDKQQLHDYAQSISRLNRQLIDFATAYRLTLPPVHYQHTPEQPLLANLHQDIDSDNDLELKFNFDQINTSFYSIERDAIIEFLKIRSRGWIEKEDKLLYLRGLAAQWNWKNNNPSLITARVQFLSNYPGFDKQYKQAQWLSIYQNSGDCLFDALALSFIQEIESSLSKDDWHRYLQTGLNLDHTWVPLHLIRSVFSLEPYTEDFIKKKSINSTNELPFNFSVETKVLYPSVFQVQLITEHNDYQAIQLHLYSHQAESETRQVDFQLLQEHTFSVNKNKYTFQLPMLKKDKFSSTFSWHQPQLDCRIYAPWKYIAL